MCGIYGITAKDYGFINQYIDKCSHRGPDGRGTWGDDTITLGHNLLSIMANPGASRQPWITPKGNILVYNGEIFNYYELKAKYKQFIDTTGCDTELLAWGLDTFDLNFIDQIDSMHGFAYYNIKKREIILSRDHAGIKPVYYAETKEGLGDGERGDLIENLKDKGVKTKGLTDKNMLLIAMGLGMMASQKPGLAGVGEGGLAGLKVVAPLMKEKSSDIQMITVKDKDGKNIVVRYNKKKGTYEKTGLTSATTGTQTKADQLREIGAMGNIPEKAMAAAYYKSLTESKGKSYEDRVDSMIKNLNISLRGFNIPLEDLRAAAEKAIGGGNSGLSLADLGLE